MTAGELGKLIGNNGLITITMHSQSFKAPVEIIDARTAFGRVDVLVKPTGGEGQAWVDANRVEVLRPTV